MERTIFLDGKYFQVNQQIIEAFSPGNFNAHGVFETMLGQGGFVLDTDLHLERLHQGLKVLGLKCPPINRSVIKEVARRNHLTEARLRLMAWQVKAHIHVMATALPYKAPVSKKFRVCLIKTNRAADNQWAQVKSLDYRLFYEAWARAQAHGYDEALLLNRKGHIFEASRANIFWIKHNVLYTPPLASGCLNGITRRSVIQQAKSLKTIVKEEDLTPEIFKKADAAFLTNSLMGLMPIDMGR